MWENACCDDYPWGCAHCMDDDYDEEAEWEDEIDREYESQF